MNSRLETERLFLTLPPPQAAARVRSYYVDNREFHRAWDPPRPRGFYTEEYWSAQLATNRQAFESGISMRLFLHLRSELEGEIVGSANFSSFVRGPFQACRLGYSLGESFQGRGFMSEALRGALAHMFGELGFHRVEANHIPTNERSGRLLRRLGFAIDGYARDYLYIDGAWRDHVLTSLTNPDPQPPPPTC